MKREISPLVFFSLAFVFLFLFGCLYMTPRTSVPSTIEVRIEATSSCENATCMCQVRAKRPLYTRWECSGGYTSKGQGLDPREFNTKWGDSCKDIRTTGAPMYACFAYDSCNDAGKWTRMTCDDCCNCGGIGTMDFLGWEVHGCACGGCFLCCSWAHHSSHCAHYYCCPLVPDQSPNGCTCEYEDVTVTHLGVSYTYRIYKPPCVGYGCMVVLPPTSVTTSGCTAECLSGYSAQVAYECNDRAGTRTFWGSCAVHYEATLQGGLLLTEIPCGANELYAITRDPFKELQYFMLGQGPSFNDFLSAREYCKPKLEKVSEMTVGDPLFEPDEITITDGSLICWDNVANSTIPVHTLAFSGPRPKENLNVSALTCSSNFTLNHTFSPPPAEEYTVTDAKTGLESTLAISSEGFIYLDADSFMPADLVVSEGQNISIRNNAEEAHIIELWFGDDTEPTPDITQTVLAGGTLTLPPGAMKKLGPHAFRDINTDTYGSIFVKSINNKVELAAGGPNPEEVGIIWGDDVCFNNTDASKSHTLHVYKLEGEMLVPKEIHSVSNSSSCCWQSRASFLNQYSGAYEDRTPGTYIFYDINAAGTNSTALSFQQYETDVSGTASYRLNLYVPPEAMSVLVSGFLISDCGNTLINRQPAGPQMDDNICVCGSQNWMGGFQLPNYQRGAYNIIDINATVSCAGGGTRGYYLNITISTPPFVTVYVTGKTSEYTVRLQDPAFKPSNLALVSNTTLCFINPGRLDRRLTSNFLPPLPAVFDVLAKSRVCFTLINESLQIYGVRDNVTRTNATITVSPTLPTNINLTMLGPSPNYVSVPPGGSICLINSDDVEHNITSIGIVLPERVICTSVAAGIHYYYDYVVRSENITQNHTLIITSSQEKKFFMTSAGTYPNLIYVYNNETVYWENADNVNHTLFARTRTVDVPMDFWTGQTVSPNQRIFWDLESSVPSTVGVRQFYYEYEYPINATDNATANATSTLIIQESKAFSQDVYFIGPATESNLSLGLAVQDVFGDIGTVTLMNLKDLLNQDVLTALVFNSGGADETMRVDISGLLLDEYYGVPAGSNVSWRNIDRLSHTLAQSGSWLGSLTLPPGGTRNVSNISAGSYVLEDDVSARRYTVDVQNLSAIISLTFAPFTPSTLTTNNNELYFKNRGYKDRVLSIDYNFFNGFRFSNGQCFNFPVGSYEVYYRDIFGDHKKFNMNVLNSSEFTDTSAINLTLQQPFDKCIDDFCGDWVYDNCTDQNVWNLCWCSYSMLDKGVRYSRVIPKIINNGGAYARWFSLNGVEYHLAAGANMTFPIALTFATHVSISTCKRSSTETFYYGADIDMNDPDLTSPSPWSTLSVHEDDSVCFTGLPAGQYAWVVPVSPPNVVVPARSAVKIQLEDVGGGDYSLRICDVTPPTRMTLYVPEVSCPSTFDSSQMGCMTVDVTMPIVGGTREVSLAEMNFSQEVVTTSPGSTVCWNASGAYAGGYRLLLIQERPGGGYNASLLPTINQTSPYCWSPDVGRHTLIDCVSNNREGIVSYTYDIVVPIIDQLFEPSMNMSAKEGTRICFYNLDNRNHQLSLAPNPPPLPALISLAPNETQCITMPSVDITITDVSTGLSLLITLAPGACSGADVVPLAQKLNSYLDNNPEYMTPFWDKFYYKKYNPFGPSWPTLLTQDISIPLSNQNCIADQLKNITKECANCTTTFAVRLPGATEADIQNIMRLARNSTDMVGFIVFANTSSICEETGGECVCNASRAWDEIKNLSRFVVYNYTKPTVILSYNLEGVGVGACAGKGVGAAFAEMYEKETYQLTGAGISGIAQYCLMDGTCQPLTGNYGLTTGPPAYARKEGFEEWFKGCADYYYRSQGLTMTMCAANETNSTMCDPSRIMQLYDEYKCRAE